MKPTTFASVALLAAAQFLGVAASGTKIIRDPPTLVRRAGEKGKQSPSVIPIPNQLTSHGCYTSGANMTKKMDVNFVSSGSCGIACKKDNYPVMGLHGNVCYCGMVYPSKDTTTDDKTCDYPCPGYDKEACGGIDTEAYSIFNTGIEIDVPSQSKESSSTSSTASSTSSRQTSAAATTAVEATATQEPDNQGDKKGGPNVAAIAAGVVVGVVVFAIGAGVIIFFVKRRRNAEIEEEHRRNAAVSAFINGSKPPGSSGSASMTDSRLDPVLAHRRMSDGSIADNQDYSRRILRVTNA